MTGKWTVNKGQYKGLEVIVLRPEGKNCVCFDRNGVFYLFSKKDLSIEIPALVGRGE